MNKYFTAIGPGVQNLYYDKLSKELIIRKIESSAKLKLDRVFKSLNLNKIQNAFFLWRDQSSRLRVKNRVAPTSEITVERTVANTLWSSNILKSRRHSAGILKRLFSEYYERTIKRRFSFWKRYTHKRRYLLIRFFDKWSIKTSRIMLNRVTMTRFMYILEKTLSQSKKSRLRNGFLQFKSQCELIRMMRKVKLLFTCWKTCARALIAGRGRQLLYFFLSWKSEIASRKEDAVVSRVCLCLCRTVTQFSLCAPLYSALLCSCALLHHEYRNEMILYCPLLYIHDRRSSRRSFYLSSNIKIFRCTEHPTHAFPRRKKVCQSSN